MILVIASVLSAIAFLCGTIALWFAFRLFIAAALEREEAEVEHRAAEWYWARARDAKSRD